MEPKRTPGSGSGTGGGGGARLPEYYAEKLSDPNLGKYFQVKGMNLSPLLPSISRMNC